MDNCLLQFDALNVFLEARLHGRSLNNFTISMQTPKFDNEIAKFAAYIACIQIFTFLTLV